MLNKNNERELVYVVKVDDILPIDGADKVEVAVVNGWRVLVQKEQFKPGDLAIYFEIDSKVPPTEPFEFLQQRDYKIKTQKFFKGTVISQGLLMSAENFGGKQTTMEDNGTVLVLEYEGKHKIAKLGDFLTEYLGVTYSVVEDNERKGSFMNKYEKMRNQHKKLFKNKFINWLYQHEWGKKILFIFFKPKKKVSDWPAWVTKTDEERIQNMPFILQDKKPWIVTEKIDGTSTTFTYMKKGKQKGFYTCSRNVVFKNDNQPCYYDTNVYTEMAKKYNVEEVLKKIVDHYDLEWVTLQGETYGAGVQKRDYSIDHHDFAGFNFIFSDKGRLNSSTAKEIMANYGIPWVPILDEGYILPDTVEELLEFADGKSKLDNKMREGLVFRYQDGTKSFKAVSNKFLMKYHA